MISAPTKCELMVLPRIAEVLLLPEAERIIYLRFYLGNFEWLIASFDPPDQLFGYVDYRNPFSQPQWTCLSFTYLKQQKTHGKEVEHDLYWQPVKFADRPRELIDIELPYIELTCGHCQRRFRENIQLVFAHFSIAADKTPCCGRKGGFAEKGLVRHIVAVLKAANVQKEKAVL